MARIRDNQRRSRARRKEYLQEVEGRLRECEQTGIAASTEIQAAGRKVADENQRLRQLLIRHGVRVEEINAFVNDSDVEAGSDVWITAEQAKSDDAKILDCLLALGKRPCGRSASCSTQQTQPVPTNTSGSTPTRIIPKPRLGSNPETWTPSSTHHEQMNVPQLAPAPIQISPQNHQFAPHLQQQPQTPIYATPQQSSAYTTPQQSSAYPTPILASQHQTMQTIQSMRPQIVSPSYPQQHPQQSQFNVSNFIPATMEQMQPSYTQPMSVGTNSCVFATDMITSIAIDAHPNDVRTDLGCPTQCTNGAAECEVDNRTVFDVMDRYSGIGR